jgi:hypothetical protein
MTVHNVDDQSDPTTEAPTVPPPAGPSPVSRPLSGQETYNVVTDTVTGVNLRISDNLIQAGIILGCVVIGVGIGALVATEPNAGAFLGGFAGLVAGFLISGIAIMIYRATRHASGKHD